MLWFVGIVIGLHFTFIAALNVPAIQSGAASMTASILSDLLHTQVLVDRIDLGLLNRVLIKGVMIADQQQQKMLEVDKITAKFEILPLFHGKIVVNTVQLFSFNALLYQDSEQSPNNFQFVLDALASKDKEQKESALDLRINSLIIRGGNITYDKRFKPTHSTFDINHLGIKDLNAHISLKALRSDSLNARIRKLSFQERSGFNLNRLSLVVEMNQKHCRLTDFRLELPHSHLSIDSLVSTFDTTQKGRLFETLETRGSLNNTTIALADLSAFMPQFRRFVEPLKLAADFRQNGRNVTIQRLHTQSLKKEIEIKCSSSLLLPSDSTDTPHLSVHIAHLDASPEGIPYIYRNLSLGIVPPLLTRIGQIHFDGEVNTNTKYLHTNGNLTTSVGSLQLNTQLTPDGSLKGSISTSTLQLNKLLANDKWGDIALDVKVDGKLTHHKPTGKVEGIIHYVDYQNYRFQEIALNTQYNGIGVEGNIDINDPNCRFSINGQALLNQSTPSYHLQAQLNDFRPAAIGLSKKEATYCGKLTANCNGNSIDNLLGDIEVTDFEMHNTEEGYSLNRFTIEATQTDELRRVSIHSDFMQADIAGNYLYTTLPNSIIKMLQRYIPSLVSLNGKKTVGTNNFTFDIRMSDATPLQKLLNIPLEIAQPIEMSGSFSEADNLLNLKLSADNFNYNNSHYEQGFIICNNHNDAFKTTIGVQKFNKNAIISLGVKATAEDDNLYTDISWDNNHKQGSFRGSLNTCTRFHKLPNLPMNITLGILPSEVVFNDTAWAVKPANVEMQGKNIHINHLMLSNGKRHLKVNGTISDNPQDSVYAELNNINLEYVFDALNFHPVDFTGMATGKVYASNLLHTPQADTHLFIRNFHFQGGLLGNANIYGKWDKEREGIYLNAYISEFASESEHTQSSDITKAFNNQLDASALTHVEGIVSPVWNGLDLMVDANQTNLHFLEGFVGNIFENIQGRGTGWCRVSGSFKDIDLTANLKADAKAKVICLNTTYSLKSDSIRLFTNRMTFNQVELTDRDGHKGYVQGEVKHHYLHNLNYNFRINSDNMLCYDMRNFGDMPFYATAYGGGNISITGGDGVLNVEAAVETRPGTLLVYDASSPDEIVNTQFITFVDKTAKDSATVKKAEQAKEDANDNESTNIRINMQVSTTPDATVKVIMDKRSGDYVSCNGSGTIQAQYFNKGSFKMFGTYDINKGMYKMSMQEVIRKDFALQNGSTVTFNGNPYQAQLDVQAVYTVNSASLADLSPNANFSQTSTTRVNCLMSLTGNLLKPSISFGLELPNVSEEDKDMVKSLVSTDDQMNRQIIYLLGIGRFYTADYAQDNTYQTNQAMNSILTSTLSGQFNQMLSQVINSSNWNFGANVSPGQNGLNDMEFQTILSGSLFNNRLLVNGNFGYRENAMANSNFVGDFDLQWLLNKTGSISLKAYNETNDRYFTKNTLTTQGVGIIFKRDFEKWSNLFGLKRRNKKKEESDSLRHLDATIH